MKVDVCIDGRPEMMEAAPAVLLFLVHDCFVYSDFSKLTEQATFMSRGDQSTFIGVVEYQVRSLIRKALALAEEEEETDDIRIMLEELESAEEEREGTILQLQKDRDLLVCKVKELEQAMSGFF
jgi:hypothetical protein